MATFSEQTNLIVDTVRDYKDLAESSYMTARQSLDTLQDAITNLPLTVVNTNIGADLSISWTASIGTPATITEPTWVQDIIDALPTAPTVPSVTVTLPEFTETAPTALTGSVGSPGAPTTDAFPTISAIGTVPTIDAVAPTIDVDVLDTEFSFTEPTYAGEISSNLETALLSIMGGSPVLAQSYWDARLAALQSDISLEQTGRLRKASNSGAASWMPLPSEARLAATDAVEDEGARALQKARLEHMLEQTRQVREDFWEAVKTGLAYEQMWVGFHDHVAQRSLGAAEQLANVAISVHNANASRFNLLLETAKLDTTIDQAQVARVLQVYEASLKETGQKLEQIKTQVTKHQAEWESKVGAFNADTTRGQQSIQRFGELVKAWSIEVDAELKSKQFPLSKAEIEAKVFETNYSALNAAANATKAILDSRVAVQDLLLKADVADADLDAKKNEIEVEVGKLTQAAQEAAAKIDVAQAQWTEGQSNALATRISELAFGWAQAAVSASHVNLGTDTSMGISQSIRADQNSPLEWTWVWG